MLYPTVLRGAGVDIAADFGGPDEGPLVLLLPGGGQTRHSWGKAGEQLAARGYRTVSLDLRGHGESGWSPDGVYDFDRFVDDLVCVLDTLAKPAFLVGASLGGLTSLLTAGERRTPVRGLALVDVAPQIELAGASRIADFMRAAPDGFASLAEAADAVAAYLPHRRRPRNPSGLMKNLRLRDGRYHWHWDPRMFGKDAREAEVAEITPRLIAAAEALTIPTLLIRGGLSEVVSQAGVDQFRAVVPHAEVVEIPDADHMVAGDRNDKFNGAVIAFLDRHKALADAGF